MRESATAAVMNGKGELLLQLRSDVPVWVLPGGGIERNETPERAVVRELLEETGLEVKVGNYVGNYVTSYALFADRTYVFVCKAIGGQLRKNAESLRLRFFSPGKLPKPMLSIHRERIIDIIAGKRNIEKTQKLRLSQLLNDVSYSPELIFRFLLFLAELLVPLRPLQKIFK